MTARIPCQLWVSDKTQQKKCKDAHSYCSNLQPIDASNSKHSCLDCSTLTDATWVFALPEMTEIAALSRASRGTFLIA